MVVTTSTDLPADLRLLDGAQRRVGDYLDATASSTHERLGAVAGVAVTVVAPDGTPHTVGASTPLARDVDAIQFDVGTGPCLHALTTGTGLQVDDLAADTRWGDYGARAAARGAGCCISVPVRAEGRTVAVFKVYGGEPGSLDAGQRETAHAVAAEVGGGFALAQHVVRLATELDDLTAMVAHRRVIDLALGVTMERAQVGAETAFGLLRTQSQHRNTKLHQVAAEVVTSVPGAGTADLVAPYDPHG